MADLRLKVSSASTLKPDQYRPSHLVSCQNHVRMAAQNLLQRFLVPVGVLALTTVTRADAINAYVAKAMKRLHIPGVSLAIMRNGRVLKARSFGFSDLEHRVAMTNQSAFMIGSVSKQFEASAILALAEEGLIGLDDPITKYLDQLPSGWESITIRSLLSHTSGLKDYTELPEHESSQTKPVTKNELIGFVGRYPLEFKPGTQWAYSNTGSLLEGLIIEKVTGRPYETFARERLWQRAGMKSTRINRWSDVIPRRVQGYVWQEGGQHRPGFEDDSWPWAGGGCVSTLDDLIAWIRALETGKVVSPTSLERLWSPIRLQGAGTYPFGLDWFLSDFRGFARIFRTGHIGGFSALIARYPKTGIDVILMCNQDGVNTPRLANEIVSLVDHNLAPVPALPAKADPDPVVTEHIKEGVADLAAGVVGSRWLAPGLATSTTDRRRGLFAASLKANATLRFICADDVRRRSIERLGSHVVEIRHYLVQFGGLEFIEGIYLDATGRVAFILDE